jgi:hypothetical protein
MFPQGPTWTLFLLPSIAISAYQIDASCRANGGKDVEQVIRNAMREASSMVDSALAHLNQDPYNQDTVDLIQRLFAKPNQHNFRDRTRVTKVLDVFNKIGQNYRTERDLAFPMAQNDVVSTARSICLLRTFTFLP